MFVNNIISFKKLPFYEKANIKLAKDYEIPAKNFLDDEYFIKMNYNPIEGEYSTDIYNEHFENIAKNQFIINKDKKELYATNMDVWNPQNRHKGLGEILHLNNIMEMLENKLEKIRVCSLSPAILFHSKYEFEPNLTDYDDIIEIMNTIASKKYNNLPQLKPIVERAAEHFDKIFYSKSFDPLYSKNLKKANNIIKDYIKTISHANLTPAEKEYYAFSHGFMMTLSKESVIEHKDFFNNLFKKHSIDYEI